MSALAQVDLGQGLETAWENIVSFVPLLAAFLVILLIGYLVAKALSKALNAVLERVGFDRAVERGGVGRVMERSKYDASDLLAKLVFYAVMLFVLQMAFGVFGENPISDLLFAVISFLPRVFVAILIVVVAAAVGAAVRDLVRAALGELSYGNALANAASIAIVAVGVFAALNQLQIAPAVVNGLFYAILAIIAGSAIIAVGGGGVEPMRRKWQDVMARAESEVPHIRAAQARGAEDEDAQAGDRPGGARPQPVDPAATHGGSRSATRTEATGPHRSDGRR